MVWDQERSAGDIAAAFEVTFGAVSQHLALLRAADLVTVRKQGNHRYYQANHEALDPYRPVLEAMWSESLQDLARVIEEDAK